LVIPFPGKPSNKNISILPIALKLGSQFAGLMPAPTIRIVPAGPAIWSYFCDSIGPEPVCQHFWSNIHGTTALWKAFQNDGCPDLAGSRRTSRFTAAVRARLPVPAVQGAKVMPAAGKFHYMWQRNFTFLSGISLIVSVDNNRCRVTDKAK
jgi:hypothetical protein